MARNVTIRLHEALVRRCRHAAVEEDKSLSQWIADQLSKAVASREVRTDVRDRAVKRLERGFPLGGRPLSRDEAHDR